MHITFKGSALIKYLIAFDYKAIRAICFYLIVPDHFNSIGHSESSPVFSFAVYYW